MAGIATQFARDRRGAIAIIFGFTIVGLIFCIGMAIDGLRAYRAANRAAAALDAAAVAAAKSLNNDNATNADIRRAAWAYFDAQTHGTSLANASFTNFTATPNRSTGTVTVKVDVGVPTTFTRLMNIQMLSFQRHSTATYRRQKIELAMVLDVTGSMNNSGKIGAMRDAAKDVVDVLLDSAEYPGDVRIGLAPYSASVNAGPYADAVRGPMAGDTCTVERQGPEALTDAAPGPAAFLGTVSGTSSNPDFHYSCPAAEVQPMISDRNSLRSRIDGFVPSGWTAGHIGTAWGWYLLSPQWGSIWPSGSAGAPYSDANTIKSVIIMTDGIFNTSYLTGSEMPEPQQIDESFGHFQQICREMKSRNINIYTVALDLTDARALTELANCATSASYSYTADNAAELRTAFRAIARNLSNLRLAR